MRKARFLVLLGLLCLLPMQAAAATVRLVEFDCAVTPATAPRILNAIDDAERAGDDFVLIRLDTPGGLVLSTDEIVKRILASRVPVVAWVGPSGARAASAGFFILMSADVAAMAPATRTGAAATINAMGPNSELDVALKKMNEDNAAFLRSIARKRGRDVEACEDAIFKAASYEESVALDRGLIDFLARDRDELLRELDGMEIRRLDGSVVTLSTGQTEFVSSPFSMQQRLTEFLGTPVIAFLLLMVGLGGLYVEITQPGVVLPGLLGALSLILFAMSTRLLPVSTIGILLILLAIVMFVLELKVPSYGMLTLGGTLCLVLGSLMLINGPIPELRVPRAVVLPTALVIAGICAVAVRLAVKAQAVRVGTGVEGLADAIGRVTQELAPEGKVFVEGEIWDAAALRGGTIPAGARVRIVSVDRMKLNVEPEDPRSTGKG